MVVFVWKVGRKMHFIKAYLPYAKALNTYTSAIMNRALTVGP